MSFRSHISFLRNEFRKFRKLSLKLILVYLKIFEVLIKVEEKKLKNNSKELQPQFKINKNEINF